MRRTFLILLGLAAVTACSSGGGVGSGGKVCYATETQVGGNDVGRMLRPVPCGASPTSTQQAPAGDVGTLEPG